MTFATEFCKNGRFFWKISHFCWQSVILNSLLLNFRRNWPFLVFKIIPKRRGVPYVRIYNIRVHLACSPFLGYSYRNLKLSIRTHPVKDACLLKQANMLLVKRLRMSTFLDFDRFSRLWKFVTKSPMTHLAPKSFDC